MIRRSLLIAAALATSCAQAATVTVTAPNFVNSSGSPKAIDLVTCINPVSGNAESCAGSGGGGTGGDTSNIKANGTTIPTTSALVGGTDGTNIRPLLLDSSGRPFVNVNSLPALATGSNTIGAISNTSFGVSSLPSIPAGSNIIGAVKIDQTTPGTTNGVVVNSSALPTGAATSANQVTLNGIVGTPGSTAPTTAAQVGGVGPSGNLRSVLVSTSGGLLPGQAAPTSTRTTLTASTITTVDSARSGRLLVTVQLDGSPSAAIYLCFNGQSGTCSATVYDIKVASGAADATIYTAPFGMTGAIYAFSTGTPIVNVTSWLVQ